jgi:hypothetical protein
LSHAASTINALPAAGRLRMRIARAMPLTETPAAHQLVEGSGPGSSPVEKQRGRVVVVMPNR